MNPSLTIVMTTYVPEGVIGDARSRYATEVFHALHKRLYYSDGPIILVIADDGSPELDYAHIVANLARENHWGATVTSTAHIGIGGSLNHAMRIVEDLWMYISDDWLLTQPLLINDAVKLIESEGYDLVRLLPIHPNLRCTTKFNEEYGWWLDIEVPSPYAFATRPFIATKQFYERIGPFRENTDAYETERDYAERVNQAGAKIAAKVDLHGQWCHVGLLESGKIPVGVSA